MGTDTFNWTSGLDNSGWIAIALMAVFFFIVLITLIIIWRMQISTDTNTKKPATKKTASGHAPARETRIDKKTAERNDDDTSPFEEAEVYLTYGLKQQAIDLLEKHLRDNPSDAKAKALLKKAQQ